MPRGGARPGAGRPRKNPEAGKKKAPKKTELPNSGCGGIKPEGAGDWPFGREQSKEPEQPRDLSEQTPLAFLLEVMRDEGRDMRLRLQAAQLAAPLVHPKATAKDKGAEEKKSSGRFARRQPPRLVASGGSKV